MDYYHVEFLVIPITGTHMSTHKYTLTLMTTLSEYRLRLWWWCCADNEPTVAEKLENVYRDIGWTVML